uniref:6-phosphogluconate dehydrogenase NADP-binding domain-containing protein n=1 Tax=Phaeomonas parva TaxID=124430 RepID=A0A7S1UEN4_9STRA
MGAGMAGVLAKTGRNLVVWNRSPEKSDALSAEFPGQITIAASAADVVKACGLTFSMLSTPAAAAAVFDAPEVGTLAGVSAGKIVVDCATLQEEDMQRMGAAVTAAGGKFLEAPVSGTKGPAATGTLIFMVTGDESAFTEATPEFEAMGKATHYLGADVGAATRMKLCVNMVMGVFMAGLGEGIHLAEKLDLEKAKLVEILTQGAMGCVLVNVKGPKCALEERNHAPNFPLKHAQKDVSFAIAAGQAAGANTMATAEATNKEMLKAMEMGFGDQDFSSVIEAVMDSQS